jgi:hypothetical protein
MEGAEEEDLREDLSTLPFDNRIGVEGVRVTFEGRVVELVRGGGDGERDRDESGDTGDSGEERGNGMAVGPGGGVRFFVLRDSRKRSECGFRFTKDLPPV